MGFVILNEVKNLNLCQQEAYRLRQNSRPLHHIRNSAATIPYACMQIKKQFKIL